MKIYANIEKPTDLNDLIKKLYSVKENDRAHCRETYSNEACTSIQCYSKKYRSFDDLLICAKTYFPETTPKELFHNLLTTDIFSTDGKKLYFHMSNCSSIRRIRCIYYYDETYCYAEYNCNKYDSQFSWEDLLEMIEIKGTNWESITDQIRNYIKTHKNKELVNETL